MSAIIRPAHRSDAPQITEMVNRFAAQNVMLPRNEENVVQTIDDWLVAMEETKMAWLVGESPAPDDRPLPNNEADVMHREEAAFVQRQNKHSLLVQDRIGRNDQSNTHIANHHLVGCGALVPLSDQLVEIRSLAIHESQQGNGLGSTLVLKLVEVAQERGYAQVCALTLRPNFFKRLGFAQVDRWSVSPKVWQACIYCPKFHRCDEVAVLMNLTHESATSTEAYDRQPGWNRLLKWDEWQPLRLAYQHEQHQRKVV